MKKCCLTVEHEDLSYLHARQKGERKTNKKPNIGMATGKSHSTLGLSAPGHLGDQLALPRRPGLSGSDEGQDLLITKLPVSSIWYLLRSPRPCLVRSSETME
jgi:hypothetical protein